MNATSIVPERRAVIDVGTNSVKLLVAEVVAGTVTPISESVCQTRLGSEFYPHRNLSAAAIARTAQAVATFKQKAHDLGAKNIRVVATNAAREAANADALVDAIHNSCGLKLEILSAEMEAKMAFYGVGSTPSLERKPLLVIEVGGGSTQITAGIQKSITFTSSLPLGAVRLLEYLQPGDPPSRHELELCQTTIRSVLKNTLAGEPFGSVRNFASTYEPFASGGTASVLAAMHQGLTSFDRGKIESTCFSHAELQQWMKRLWNVPISQRRKLPGLPPERADVILTGAAILEAVVEFLGLRTIRVSTRGLRFGAMLI